MNESEIMQMNVENREKDAANLRKKILLVDDDPAVRQILMRLLSDEGYLVVAAANATEAIYFSGLMMFDLLLIDVVPVAGTGWEMFQRLWLKNPRLAFIMITERSGRYFDSVASGLGVFLEKPLDFTKLFFTLRNLLDGPAEIRLARQLRTP